MIISQRIIEDHEISKGRRYLRYEFTDHLGIEHPYGQKLVPSDFDADADLLAQVPVQDAILALQEITNAITQAESGINPDKVSVHQDQSDFDRRVLGSIMINENAHTVLAAYPMFQAMEIRGGANANQRAVYLEITRPTYDLIDNRFSDVNPVAFFLNDEKEQIWSKLPDGYY